jgi:hypothetical protein
MGRSILIFGVGLIKIWGEWYFGVGENSFHRINDIDEKSFFVKSVK